MTRLIFLTTAMLVFVGLDARADDPAAKAKPGKEATKATFLVTGLHCPPCATTIELSLKGVKGIHSVKVVWKTKNVRLEFDESLVPAQRVAQLVAATPHMMGGNLHYSAWLALKAPDVKDDATAKPIKEALSKVVGIKQVVVYPKQHSVGIAFDAKGSLTSAQLIELLAKVGIKSENM